jgi:DNA-binding SARP family transcriptional activator
MSRETTVSHELHLLGCFALFVDHVPVEVAGREQRLLALLTLRGPQTRAVLAGTLWPDSTEDRARASLRSAVMRLRRVSEDLLDIVRSRVALGGTVLTDVQRLTTYLDRVELRDRAVFDDTLLALRTLRARHLLPGWYDDWLLDDREDLHHRQIRALEALARHALEHDRPDLAVVLAEAAAMREPLLESLQAVMIRAHLMCGNPTAAIGEYRKYRSRLGRELGIRPSPALTRLVQSTGFAPRASRKRAAGL